MLITKDMLTQRQILRSNPYQFKMIACPCYQVLRQGLNLNISGKKIKTYQAYFMDPSPIISQKYGCIFMTISI